MGCQIDVCPAGFVTLGLSSPDIKRSAELFDQRHVFQRESQRLESGDCEMRRQRMDDVIRNYIDIDKPLMRGNPHELILTQADLASCIAHPTSNAGKNVLDNGLGIPVIGLE